MASLSGRINDTEFSDLTFKLSDGREIKAHKLIVCKQNKYLASLCGPASAFAKAKNTKIEIPHDNADAVEEVLRKLYGCTLPAAESKSWRFWFDLVLTASKYGEEQLSRQAEARLVTVAKRTKNVDTIIDVTQSINSRMADHPTLLEFAEDLRKQNLLKLQENKRYRDLLFNDRDLMESQFKALGQIGISSAGETRQSMCARITWGQCSDSQSSMVSQLHSAARASIAGSILLSKLGTSSCISLDEEAGCQKVRGLRWHADSR